jgi:hypothetical protein
MEVVRDLAPDELKRRRFTGLTYDGGRTSLPWAVWWAGKIRAWKESEEEAERVFRRIQKRKS